MGVENRSSISVNAIVERPLSALLAFVGLYLAADLILKLAGIDLQLGGYSVLGGYEPMNSFVSKVANGLLRGLIIGLTGIGLSMTYSILGFANFAHGDFITVGAFIGTMTSYVIAGVLGAATYDIGALTLIELNASDLGLAITGGPIAFLAIVLGLLIAGAGTVGVILLTDHLAFKPLRDRSGVTLLITSIGVALVLRYLVNFVWGTSKRNTYTSSEAWDLAIPIGNGALRLDAHDFTLLILGVALMLGVHLLLQTSKLGKAMRAMADNKDLAKVTGIPTDRVVQFTWILGGSLTGVAGYTWVLWRGTFGWFDGWLFLLLVFAAVILGGIGSIYGAMAGGLIIGLTHDLSTIFIPPALQKAAAFALMIVVLVVRPSGLFGGRTTA
ncbi:branched-chain amino acid ABC transporter permease [Halobacteriales archaeon QS_9_68_42]|nr:MAG: branched-chain amino acid ABC transporter permease [Halobacteriales archaeon QS_1_68_44]PSQ39612.1 MAG: branched-chain amino acid ABC transporter permease [Halobacteriales archaeon QS_9_68_42]